MLCLLGRFFASWPSPGVATGRSGPVVESSSSVALLKPRSHVARSTFLTTPSIRPMRGLSPAAAAATAAFPSRAVVDMVECVVVVAAAAGVSGIEEEEEEDETSFWFREESAAAAEGIPYAHRPTVRSAAALGG